MNFDVLFWLSVLSCGAVFARTARSLYSGHGRGWAVVSGSILAIALAGMFFFPATVGNVTGALWAVFILAPSLLGRAVLRSGFAQNYVLARRLARVVGLLHPADGWRELPKFYGALALFQAGSPAEAAAALNDLITRPSIPSAVARAAHVYLFRLQGQWEELLEWAAHAASAGQGNTRLPLALDPNVILMRLRALGETGRLGEMLTVFQATRRRLEQFPHPTVWPMSQLYVFAFGGRERATETLLKGPLSGLPTGAGTFWRATAQMAAGQQAAARTILRDLAAGSQDRELCQAVERRLNHDLADPRVALLPRENDLLAQVEADGARDIAYHPRPAGGLRFAHATLVLIALNLAMFGLEIAQGGSQDEQTLYRLGAMWPPAVLVQGEWYRLVAALFLHFGPLHIGMNLLGLAVIGPWVEKALGWARYLVVYFVAGIGSMLAVLGLIRWGWMREEVLVGASGAIMGLVGAMGTLFAAGWRRERSRLAARRLRSVLLIVAFQVVFDLLTPQVSFAAHSGGVLIGFAVTALLMAVRPPRRAPPSAPAPAISID